jgi:hypothetical protein
MSRSRLPGVEERNLIQSRIAKRIDLIEQLDQRDWADDKRLGCGICREGR